MPTHNTLFFKPNLDKFKSRYNGTTVKKPRKRTNTLALFIDNLHKSKSNVENITVEGFKTIYSECVCFVYNLETPQKRNEARRWLFSLIQYQKEYEKNGGTLTTLERLKLKVAGSISTPRAFFNRDTRLPPKPTPKFWVDFIDSNSLFSLRTQRTIILLASDILTSLDLPKNESSLANPIFLSRITEYIKIQESFKHRGVSRSSSNHKGLQQLRYGKSRESESRFNTEINTKDKR